MSYLFANSDTQRQLLIAPSQIVVATDLTDSEILLPHIVSQALAHHAHVTLVHAILPANLLTLDGTLSYPEQERLDRSITGMVIDFGARIRALGVSCDVVAEHGFSADVIRKQIETRQATRLIVATHGRGKLGRLALGSVAAELLRSITVPIFAVGRHAASQVMRHATPRKILHPVSLTGNSLAHAEFVHAVAADCGAQLTLLHVLEADQPGRTDQAVLRAQHALRELLPSSGLQTKVDIQVCLGERTEKILEYADRISADWIIAGLGAKPPYWPLQESTAYRLMASALCPVFTCGRKAIGEKPPLAALEESRVSAQAGKLYS
ncbi:universal stress protein [Silvibacterium dinghuense]|uniref:Universal stress protein n=1 Tax=Silvibacterium dinghuense TaxID=1560006 RepID=A0A4Q1SGT1_9BACT|nr:universal stress protein [Silvibacterium dinghuense]RXS96557.1 universal stress protein [Silvibacterium dinghuense]GGG91754.1 hypothetical protein GCM10011586_02990 [Silvibacterium dinghuense]